MLLRRRCDNLDRSDGGSLRAAFVVSVACALAACTLLTNTDGLNAYVDPQANDAAALDALADVVVNDTGSGTSDAADGKGPLSAAEYAALVATDTPYGYWRLADTVGPTAKDEMGTHPGTYGGAPTFGAAGPLAGGTAVQFHGGERMNADSVVGPVSAWNAMTFELWFSTSLVPGEEGSLFEVAGPKGNDNIAVFIDTPSQALKVKINNAGNTTFTTTPTVLGGMWHHMALVITATSTILYLDGLSIGGLNDAGIPTIPVGGLFGVGVDYDYSADAGPIIDPGNAYKGRIAEVVLYDHVFALERIVAYVVVR